MLLTPQLGGKFFGIPLAPETNVLGRLFGIRDLTLGLLLWKVSSAFSGRAPQVGAALVGHSARDFKHVLVIGAIVDSVDVISCLISAWHGEIEGKALFWGPFGAGLFAVLQLLAWRKVKG